MECAAQCVGRSRDNNRASPKFLTAEGQDSAQSLASAGSTEQSLVSARNRESEKQKFDEFTQQLVRVFEQLRKQEEKQTLLAAKVELLEKQGANQALLEAKVELLEKEGAKQSLAPKDFSWRATLEKDVELLKSQMHGEKQHQPLQSNEADSIGKLMSEIESVKSLVDNWKAIGEKQSAEFLTNLEHQRIEMDRQQHLQNELQVQIRNANPDKARISFSMDQSPNMDKVSPLESSITPPPIPCLPPPELQIPTSEKDETWERSVTSKTFQVEDTTVFHRKIAQNTWEAMLLVYLDHLGCLESFFVLFAFIVTFIIQITFVLIVHTDSFTGESLPNLDSIKEWRYSVAHDYVHVNSIGRHSLTSMVCQLDASLVLSSSQRDVLATIEAYLEPLPLIGNAVPVSGISVSIMAMLVWTMSITKAFCVGSVQMTLSVIKLKASRQTKIVVDGDGYGELTLESINHLRRVCFCLLAVLRLGIQVLLFVSGLRWISHTTSVTDLLLNCTALSMVLDIGELSYLILLPEQTKQRYDRFKPLILPNPGPLGGIAPSVFAIALLVSSTIGVHISTLAPQADLMEDTKSIMCGGNQDFVTSRAPVSNVLMVGSTHPYRQSIDRQSSFDTFLSGLTKGLTESSAPETVQKAMYFDSWSDYENSITGGFEFLVANWLCFDTVFDEASPFVSTARALYGTSLASSCSTLEPLCDGGPNVSFVRMLCPETCGCFDVRSGLVGRMEASGCPMTSCRARPDRMDQLASLPCTDENVTSLPGWDRYFRNLNVWFNPDDADIRDGIEKIRQLGCEGLPVHDYLTEILCLGGPQFLGMKTFCPVHCGCTSNATDCPISCPPISR